MAGSSAAHSRYRSLPDVLRQPLAGPTYQVLAEAQHLALCPHPRAAWCRPASAGGRVLTAGRSLRELDPGNPDALAGQPVVLPGRRCPSRCGVSHAEETSICCSSRVSSGYRVPLGSRAAFIRS